MRQSEYAANRQLREGLSGTRIAQHNHRSVKRMKTPDQSAIDAANNAPLFNIPPNTWRDNWIGARNGEPYSVGFWMGIYCSTSFTDPDYDDRSLLASIARIMRTIK